MTNRNSDSSQVSRLQEQLQKERELRTTLEAGLKPSRGTLAEGNVINVEKSFDIGVQLNQKTEQNHQAKLKDKKKGTDSTATLCLEKSRSKDTCDAAESENKKKHELGSTNLPGKQLLQNQQLNPIQNRISKSVVVPASSTAAELVVVKPVAPTNTKRFGARGEGTNSTTSALSKLTNRLNILKERRSQIASELQSMDKGQGSVQSVQNLDKGRASESNQSLQKPDKCQGSEVRSDKTHRKGTKSRDK